MSKRQIEHLENIREKRINGLKEHHRKVKELFKEMQQMKEQKQIIKEEVDNRGLLKEYDDIVHKLEEKIQEQSIMISKIKEELQETLERKLTITEIHNRMNRLRNEHGLNKTKITQEEVYNQMLRGGY